MATLSKSTKPSAPNPVVVETPDAGSPDAGSPDAGGGGGGTPPTHTPKIILEGITFDDVLLVPARSSVLPSEADTSTNLTASIRLNIPLLSAPMDTVTESALAIALAQEGGIGIIHKNLSPEVQAREVAKVKRSANGVIEDPVTLDPDDTIGDAIKLMRKFNVSGFPVTEGDSRTDRRSGGKVVGILTRRDLKFVETEAAPVRDVMTADHLITAPPGTTLAEAEIILNRNKVEKLLILDKDGNLAGLITTRDIDRLSQFPDANTDERGRLRCGAAIGVNQLDRAEALLDAEVDVIVVDTAHGHSENVLRTVAAIKERWPEVQVIAGNVATAEGARDLVLAGADAVKVGIGPGSICTTRVVTGVGVPQITAIMEACRGVVESGRDVPVIADGGVRMSGDIAKALAAGASCVMLGSLFAGLDESPGELVISGGRRYKTYRGMGSEGAMNAGSADRYGQAEKYQQTDKPNIKFVPEGVEGLVAYRGPLAEFVYQLVGGLRASLGYTGCGSIELFRERARFCRVSGATVIENHPHDIRITKESPNYTVEHVRD